jgi:hypothetical protein
MSKDLPVKNTDTEQRGMLESLTTTGEWDPAHERRRSLRVALHLTLYLAIPGSAQLRHTTTQDVSSDGFYCFLNASLTPGEWINCDLLLGSHAPGCETTLLLRCRAQVMRVEKFAEEERYGIACRIDDYRVVPSPACP